MADWIRSLVDGGGYLTIAFLMFLENVFPPIPSEVIMPLAGSSATDGRLSIIGVIAAGSAGSLAGALLWYAIGRKLGDERIKRWSAKHGRWLTLAPGDIEKAENWFGKHGTKAVFLARLVPTLRTLIAIPAGIFAMPLTKFIPLTFAGTLLWEGALALAGYKLGDQYQQIEKYLNPITTGIFVILVLYYLYRVITFRSDKT
ncbi:alkaline phosphatase [Erythrobacter sp. HI0037]|nr:alkaline phosphatase [Erythrobacter sp. HI0020]KZY16720.1 alkaline phosphatase [Erythrobacter sp. HI0038]KZY18607.1 alkaline phosphatase [Erythrobacter sp. HI0038]KZY28923.1 alkaline phosphatase [Erythrobacter sp. HI0037]